MKTLRLNLPDRSYSILVGKELLSNIGAHIKRHGIQARTALVVTQKAVAIYYEKAVRASLEKEGFRCEFFIPPAAKSSEAAKSQAVYSKLIKKIVAADGQNKSVFLIALGGGVIGDLTGFAASLYRRGIPYVQAPTTLTAQVDSAIGGKTAIDLPEGKNLLGTVYQPALVLSDYSALNSLPERHWSDGFAEVIKYGVIRDAALFGLLEHRGKDGIRSNAGLLEKVVYRCAKIKAHIVEKDEFDKKGVRIVLNFGHTAGHAIEAASSFSHQYTHGEAVGIGMLVACDIAEKLGVLKDKGLTGRLEKTLMKFGLPLFYRGLDQAAILTAIGYDKKSLAGVNRFVLPVSLGKTTIMKNVPANIILEALAKRKG